MKKPKNWNAHWSALKSEIAMKTVSTASGEPASVMTRNVAALMIGPTCIMTVMISERTASKTASVATSFSRRRARRAPIAGSQALYLTNLIERTISVKRLTRRSVARRDHPKTRPTADPTAPLSARKTAVRPSATRQYHPMDAARMAITTTKQRGIDAPITTGARVSTKPCASLLTRLTSFPALSTAAALSRSVLAKISPTRPLRMRMEKTYAHL